METLTVNGQLFALSKLHVGGNDKTGIWATIAKDDYMMEDGSVERIPIVPGSGIRGKLRRLLLDDFIDQVGYTIKTPKLFYLKSGGALEEVSASDSGRLDLGMRRSIRMYLHPLSLFGGSMGNQAFAGKLEIFDGQLICKELYEAGYLAVPSKIKFSRFIGKTFMTRHAERELPVEVAANMRTGKKGSANAEPTIQMKVDLEVLIRGSRFTHKFKLLDTSPLEKSCFARMIELWRDRPNVGGKSAVGFGELRLDYPDMPWSSMEYLRWVSEHKADVVQALEKLDTVSKIPEKPQKQKQLADVTPKDDGDK